MNENCHRHEDGSHERIRGFHEHIREMENFGGLRSWILFTLNEGPKNGVEIMNAIQKATRFIHPCRHHHGPHHPEQCSREEEGDAWRPSPGSIYPMLNKMTNEDLIKKNEDGRYEMTQTGQDAFLRIFGRSGSHGVNPEHGRYSVENVLQEMDGYASYLEEIAKDKLSPHEAAIDELLRKLGGIKEKLHQ